MHVRVTPGTMAQCEQAFMVRHRAWLARRTQDAQHVPTGPAVPWSDQELAIVAQFWGRLSRERLCALLPGRSFERVRRAAARLGIVDRPLRNLVSRFVACQVLRTDWRSLTVAAKRAGIRLHCVPTRPRWRYATPRTWARVYALHCGAWMSLDPEAQNRIYRAALARLEAARDAAQGSSE